MFVSGKGSAARRLPFHAQTHGLDEKPLPRPVYFVLAGEGSETRRLPFLPNAAHGLNLAHLQQDSKIPTLTCFVPGRGSATRRLPFNAQAHGLDEKPLPRPACFLCAGEGSETRRLRFVPKDAHGLDLACLQRTCLGYGIE